VVVLREPPVKIDLQAFLFTKLPLKVTYFQRRFLKRTAPTNELTEAALFSQPPIKMTPQIPLLPPQKSLHAEHH
jgi:hypothetical protein